MSGKMRTNPARAAFHVSVCGHRKLSEHIMPHLKAVLNEALGILHRETQKISNEYRNFYRPFIGEDDVASVLICNLAEGADILAAREALKLGYELNPVLPCDPSKYAESFDDAAQCEEMQNMLKSAPRSFILPENKRCSSEGYADASTVLLNQADVLIALWDGQYTRYIAGTSAIIRQAKHSNVPVLYIDSVHPEKVVYIHDGICHTDWQKHLVECVRRALLPENRPESELCAMAFDILPPVGAKRVDRYAYDAIADKIALHPFTWFIPASAKKSQGRSKSDSPPIGGEPRRISQPIWDALKRIFSNASGGYAKNYRNELTLRFFLPFLGVIFLLMAQSAHAFGIDSLLSGILGVSEASAEKIATIVFSSLHIISLLSVFVLVWHSHRNKTHMRYGVYRVLAENCRINMFLWPVGCIDIIRDESDGLLAWYTRYLHRCFGLPNIRLTQEEMRQWLQWLSKDLVESQLKYHIKRVGRSSELEVALGRLAFWMFCMSIAVTVVCSILTCLNAGGTGVISLLTISIWGGLSIVLPCLASFWAGYSNNAGHSAHKAMSDRMVTSFSYIRDEAERLANEPELTYSDLVQICRTVHEKCMGELKEWDSNFQSRNLQYVS